MVTVTLTTHPHFGRELAVIRQERSYDGRHQYVLVVEPGGGHRKLPIEWTSIVPSVVTPQVEGRDVVRIGRMNGRIGRMNGF